MWIIDTENDGFSWDFQLMVEWLKSLCMDFFLVDRRFYMQDRQILGYGYRLIEIQELLSE